jgi:hypothetical protein
MMGQGYSLNPLLSMRIHDINVEADIMTSIPQIPEPIEEDGTYFPESQPDPYVESTYTAAGLSTETWWTGWWPVLHLRSTETLDNEGYYTLEMTVDIIGAVSFQSFNITTPQIEQLNEAGMTAAAAAANDDFWADAMPQIDIPKYIAEVLLMALEAFVIVLTPYEPLSYQIMLGMLGAWILMMLVWLNALTEAVRMRLYSPGAAWNDLFEMLFFTIGASIVDAYFGAIKFYRDIWKKFKDSGSFRACALWGAAFNVLNVVTKFIFAVIILRMMVHYQYAHLEPFTQNPDYLR